jgi:hypothetical protein
MKALDTVFFVFVNQYGYIIIIYIGIAYWNRIFYYLCLRLSNKKSNLLQFRGFIISQTDALSFLKRSRWQKRAMNWKRQGIWMWSTWVWGNTVFNTPKHIRRRPRKLLSIISLFILPRPDCPTWRKRFAIKLLKPESMSLEYTPAQM